MATKEFFLNEIERLKFNFNEHSYKTECVGFIWQEVKHVDDNDLKKVVDQFIADNSFPPKRKDFCAALANMRIRRWQETKQEATRAIRQWSEDEKQNMNKKLKSIREIIDRCNFIGES